MSSANFSPIDFFVMAGIAGKAVMLSLLLASVWCWVLIIEGTVGVFCFKAALRGWRVGERAPLVASITEAGDAAVARRLPGEGIGDTRLRIIEAMNREARSVIASVEGGLANLAVISSVSPFVGLLGTVMGILNALIGIGVAGQASIDKVAGPVGEALIMTAIGLFVAVPAVLLYNWLVRRNKVITEKLRAFAGDLQAYLISKGK